MKAVSTIALATTLALGFNSPADAAEVLSVTGSGAVGNCQPALPVYDGKIRKRPLALINEGTGPAFATCAFTSEEISLGIKNFSSNITNLSAVTVTVNCTAVVGEESAAADYFPKSIVLTPGEVGVIVWTEADNGGLLFDRSVAISCNLPSFVGLNRNRITTVLSIV